MAVSLKHTTQAVGTDAGNGEIRKAQWNEEHTLTAAANTVLGAVSAGAVGEITCTAAGRALLDDADAAAQRVTLSAAGTGVSNTFSANQIIEVTDNTNAALRVTQLGTGNAILVEDSTNPDATPLVVNNDGVIVSGYTTTATIANSSYRTYLLGSGIYYPLAVGYTGASALGAVVSFAKSRGADWGTRGIVSNGDAIGSLVFAADDGSTLNSIGAVIQANVDGTPGVGDMPGRLAFFTTPDGASSTTERMRIRSDGNIGIGGAGSANRTVLISKTVTGGTAATSLQISASSASDVTSNAIGAATFLGTDAAAFTMTALSHFSAVQGTIGAGSSVLAQYGFISSSLNIGATNNYGFFSLDTAAVTSGKTAYGFYSGINTATGGGTTWGFYAAGTAPNYFAGQVQLAAGSAGTPSLSAFGDTNTGMWYPAADTIAWSTGGSERMRIRSDGNIGIGGTGNAATSLSIQKAITGGTTAVGADVATTVQSDVTTQGLGYNTTLGTQAATFTTNIQHYRASQGTFGAGSTVAVQYGFSSTSGLTGATQNYAFIAGNTAAVTSGKEAYGFYSAINTATGGGTTYGFYAAGTARNLFSGDVQVFGAGGLGYTTGSGGAVTQATSRTTGVTLNKTNGAITLVSAAGSTTWQSFTVTNSTVAATDTVIVSQKSGTDLHMISVTAVAAGSFRISFATTGGTTTEQPVFNFAVIKAVTA